MEGEECKPLGLQRPTYCLTTTRAPATPALATTALPHRNSSTHNYRTSAPFTRALVFFLLFPFLLLPPLSSLTPIPSTLPLTHLQPLHCRVFVSFVPLLMITSLERTTQVLTLTSAL